jgi:N-glycosylase/DNA lyase
LAGSATIAELKRDYRSRRRAIERRLADFRAFQSKDDAAIFEELCFCIVTAGSSARMGLKTLDAIKDILHNGTEKELQKRACSHRLRFWRLRPSYIYHTREYLRDSCSMKLLSHLRSITDPLERRDFLARNKAVKGLGYKEASHFLRNIGFSGYAILDKHIVNSLRELGVISSRLKPTSRKGYLAIERKMARFAEQINIDMDHLDLLLWSRKTGEILK